MIRLQSYITEAANRKPTIVQKNFMNALSDFIDVVKEHKLMQSDWWKKNGKFYYSLGFDGDLIPIDYLCLRFGMKDYSLMKCFYCTRDFSVLYDESTDKRLPVNYIADIVLKEWTLKINDIIKQSKSEM